MHPIFLTPTSHQHISKIKRVSYICTMKQTLSNNLLTVEISSAGAELQSIVNNHTRHQYLWQGDKKFWGRRSPVLFPIVGSVWNGEFRMDSNTYTMGQHGFARDMEFECIEDAPENEAWFALESTDETLAKYPRKFRLEIGYRLESERLMVIWRVKNTDTKPMTFQIGAHPAFNMPDFSTSDTEHGYFLFDNRQVKSQVIAEKGCIGTEEKSIELNADGMLPIDASTFKSDALIFADNQVHRVSLLDKAKHPYISLLFRAPLVGLWSPAADCPFVCIEPWWGRADSVGFTGDFADRLYVNTIAPGEEFEASYMVIFEDL